MKYVRDSRLMLFVALIPSFIVVSSTEQILKPLCYHCFYEKYLDLDSGDSDCRHPKEASTKTEQCPSGSCAKRIVNTNQHYQVQRYCLARCRQVEFAYNEIKGQVHCCTGHLCNGQTRIRYDIRLFVLFVFLSLAVGFPT
ncbi:hypothetical protein LSH36_45g04009 [Paralvinella palmiformis]|uniref:Protein quiver n=1 Tax=Paralvinella palmiformis TaxID=53620 RepID=A0AAD9K836_9ANNE|nr:hypothetical protein LSH36_45g04009 [Paralvinella palmiformis]